MDQEGHRNDTGALSGDLAHIRTLMERSSRFISLSGLSGVFAGVMALGGARLAQYHVARAIGSPDDGVTYDLARTGVFQLDELSITLLVDAIMVLVLALLGAFWFTW
ncbi:MAG TPA: hypothetical protein PKX39_14900, partial [Flavobacteriales bacterium]|nr:hypothetical protein [Flavobacteriales bacterium]